MMRPVLVAMPPVKADTLSFDRVTKTLTWNDASIAETSFDAQVSTDAGATWATFGTIADPLSKPNVLETRSLPYPAYDPDTIYQFQVVAKNTVGYGGAFPEMTVQSVSAPLTVGLETTTTLTSDINPSTVGQNVTFTATVSPAAATGTVTFSDGATVLGTGTLTGGVATFSTSTLALGTHPITAAYGGDATYSNSTSLPLDQVVTQIDTATVVLGAPNPSLVGDSVTFTATVTPAAATGTVTFNVDGIDIASPPTLVGGVATYTISTLTAGSHPIIATYSGDGTYLPSSDTTTQVVNLIPTTTTLAGVPNPSLFGQDVVFTATVSPAAAGGTVTFTVDGTAGTPVAVAAGQASFTAAGLGVGAHTVIAAYSGDATYAASTSAPYAQGVGLALTTTTVVSDINPSDLGQLVTFTATVSPAAATGTVEFFDGATSLGTAPLAGSTASLPFASLTVGTHAITAVYGGDSSYAGSTSAAITQTVNQVPTTTTLASSLNPSILGDTVTFTATLSTSFATGTVTFSIDGVAGAPVSVAAGSASFSTAALGVGDHTITATYGGDATYLGSTDTLTQTVNKAPTTTIVTSSLNPSILGQNVTFTATLSPSAATGTVTFTVDGTAGAPVTLAAGSASISTATLAVGAHTITAAYSGDGTYAASTSAPFSQTVDPLPAPTNLTAVAVSSTQINLAWLGTAPSETGFTLQRATSPAFTSRPQHHHPGGQHEHLHEHGPRSQHDLLLPHPGLQRPRRVGVVERGFRLHRGRGLAGGAVEPGRHGVQQGADRPRLDRQRHR